MGAPGAEVMVPLAMPSSGKFKSYNSVGCAPARAGASLQVVAVSGMVGAGGMVGCWAGDGLVCTEEQPSRSSASRTKNIVGQRREGYTRIRTILCSAPPAQQAIGRPHSAAKALLFLYHTPCCLEIARFSPRAQPSSGGRLGHTLCE